MNREGGDLFLEGKNVVQGDSTSLKIIKFCIRINTKVCAAVGCELYQLNGYTAYEGSSAVYILLMKIRDIQNNRPSYILSSPAKQCIKDITSSDTLMKEFTELIGDDEMSICRGDIMDAKNFKERPYYLKKPYMLYKLKRPT